MRAPIEKALAAALVARSRRKHDRSAILARFEAQYIPEPNSGCWLWVGSTCHKGYGLIFFKTRQKTAHRVSWQLFRGEIPSPLWVLHKCDTPACVNPDHLYLGDVKRNVLDAMERGRLKNPPLHVGEAHHFTRLTEKIVQEIRQRYATGKIGQRDLAQQYGVRQSSIWAIVNRRSWKSVA